MTQILHFIILNGNKNLAKVITGKEVYISFITELELLGYKNISSQEKQIVANFINDCNIIDINKEIKESTIKIRQQYNIKIPDAIIAATATTFEIQLLTADKGFSQISPVRLRLQPQSYVF